MKSYRNAYGVIALVGAFGLGWQSHSLRSKPEIVQTQAEEQVKKDKDIKQVVTEVITKEPSGKEVRTVVTETETKVVTVKDKNTESKTETKASDQYTINLMAGISKDNLVTPIYGASASKKFIGPISLGAWALTNGTGGLSVGMSF